MRTIFILITLVVTVSTATAQSMTIDFTIRDTVSNMVGFLHAMDATEPDDSLILPLNPEHWRAGGLTSTIYNRATSTIGAEYMIAVSDLYGYPPGWTPPYMDTTGYKTFIDNLCIATAATPMIYDIWNEPNGTFWSGGQVPFFETFKRAHDRIRYNLGTSAQICGPSIENADTTYIREFCDYCLANNIQLDILSFHWFYNDSIMPYFDDALLWCRSNFIDNPTYAPLQIKEIIVNEIVNEPGQYKPAFNLAHFYYLEKGKANGACKACWNANDSSGTETCFNNTLNGLLTPGTHLKRGAYWSFKAYAEMDSIRYSTASSNNRIFSMTGNHLLNSDTVRMIIGYYHSTTPLAPTSLNVTLNGLNSLPAFPSGDSIKIDLYEIPNTEFHPLAQPQFLGQFTYANNSGTINLSPIPLDTNAVVYADIYSTSTSLGILADDNNRNSTTVYPNPSMGTFTVNGESNSTITIYNSAGDQVIKTLSISGKMEIDLRGFEPGIYFLQVTNDVQIVSFTIQLLR